MHPYPIDHILPELKKAVLGGPAVVLQAPPGSGKTTRVPLALLKALSPAQGRIIMLEPRRIAAVAAARWMARLLGEPVGKTIGYAIRFDRRISKDTRLEVVTEGILTRRLIDDPALVGVAMIIFDEFHERSLQADLALALSLDIQRNLREDLKLLVMSATIETAPIAALLGGAPVITARGETFPVTEHFLPEGGGQGARGMEGPYCRRGPHRPKGYDGGHPHFPARGRRNPPGRGKSPGCHHRVGRAHLPPSPLWRFAFCGAGTGHHARGRSGRSSWRRISRKQASL